MVHQLLQPALIIFGVTLPLWIVFRLFIKVYNEKINNPFSFKRELIFFLFFTYIVSVLIITIVPTPVSQTVNLQVDRTNLTPVTNTVKQLETAKAAHNKIEMVHLLENTVGNVILFIPLGILLPIASRKINSAIKVIGVSFIFSCSIELFQFIAKYVGMYRTADIDDIILNTLGGFLGFMLVYLIVLRKRPAMMPMGLALPPQSTDRTKQI